MCRLQEGGLEKPFVVFVGEQMDIIINFSNTAAFGRLKICTMVLSDLANMAVRFKIKFIMYFYRYSVTISCETTRLRGKCGNFNQK